MGKNSRPWSMEGRWNLRQKCVLVLVLNHQQPNQCLSAQAVSIHSEVSSARGLRPIDCARYVLSRRLHVGPRASVRDFCSHWTQFLGRGQRAQPMRITTLSKRIFLFNNYFYTKKNPMLHACYANCCHLSKWTTSVPRLVLQFFDPNYKPGVCTINIKVPFLTSKYSSGFTKTD